MCLLVHEEVRDQSKPSFIRNHPHFLEVCFIYYYSYACMICTPAHTCHGAQVEVRGQLTVVDFSPSTTWVLETRLGSLGWLTNAFFTCWATSLAPIYLSIFKVGFLTGLKPPMYAGLAGQRAPCPHLISSGFTSMCHHSWGACMVGRVSGAQTQAIMLAGQRLYFQIFKWNFCVRYGK